MKTLTLLIVAVFTFNAMAEMGKMKVTKESKFEKTRESKIITEIGSNTSKQKPIVAPVRTDAKGQKLMTLEQVYRKYGDSDEAQNYIRRNEMEDLVEERNKKMQ